MNARRRATVTGVMGVFIALALENPAYARPQVANPPATPYLPLAEPQGGGPAPQAV